MWKRGRGAGSLRMWENMDEWNSGKELGLSIRNWDDSVMQMKTASEMSWNKETDLKQGCIAGEEAVVICNKLSQILLVAKE